MLPFLPEPACRDYRSKNIRHLAEEDKKYTLFFETSLYIEFAVSNCLYIISSILTVSYMLPSRRFLSCLRYDCFTGTDIVKMIVMVSLSVVSLMLTMTAPLNALPFCSLIYCIPILFVALWFPGQAFRATALLVAGFLFIQTYLFTLGFTIDPLLTALHTMIFFWFFGAATLFSQDSQLAASRCRQIVGDTRKARFLCDPKTLRVLCASKKCADMLDYVPSELIGIPAEVFWADEAGRTWFLDEMEREGYIGNAEMAFHAQNGALHRVLLSCRALASETLYECTIVDIGRLPGGGGEPARSNRQLMDLIQQTNDIFFILDTAGCFLHFSWTRASEYGLSHEEIVGKSVDALLPPDPAEVMWKMVRTVIEEQNSAHYDIDVKIRDATHTFSVTLAPYSAVCGAFTGVVGSARDISEAQRQRVACRQLTWEVEQWKGLVTRLAHELRTPLQPLVGYLRMIAEEPGQYGLTGNSEKIFRTCLSCAEQEQRVVERVVDLSLLMMDYVDLTIQDIPLRELAEDTVARGDYTKDVRIHNDIPDNVNILGDPDRLSAALAGLLSNAATYNEPPVEVWIEYASSNENHYIMVRDNGIGIPRGDIESIFEPFYTGGSSQEHNGGKAGLGLPVANKYVQLHGGDITVTSEVGKGSTFTIRIPREV